MIKPIIRIKVIEKIYGIEQIAGNEYVILFQKFTNNIFVRPKIF